MKRIDIEGYTADEILALPDEQLDGFVLTGEPLVFRAGSANILGEFKIRAGSLLVELAQRRVMPGVRCATRNQRRGQGGGRR